MAEDFIRRRHGETPVDTFAPAAGADLERDLRRDLVPEQVMQISSVMGGFTLGEADLLRRAMGKKKEAELQAQRGKFAGAKAKGVDEPDCRPCL